jgi:transcription elongation factor GreA
VEAGNLMTAEGLEALRAEVERLETDERGRIAEQIKVARSFGDLKENAEYHAAKEAQAHLETKILQLRARLIDARVVEVTEGDVAGFGSSVVLVDEGTGRELRYTLVAQPEQDPSAGKVSVETPVGRALIGKRAGDVATITTPRGERRLRVRSVG